MLVSAQSLARLALVIAVVVAIACFSHSFVLNTPYVGVLICRTGIFSAASGDPVLGDWQFRWVEQDQTEEVAEFYGFERPRKCDFGAGYIDWMSIGPVSLYAIGLRHLLIIGGLGIINLLLYWRRRSQLRRVESVPIT